MYLGAANIYLFSHITSLYIQKFTMKNWR